MNWNWQSDPANNSGLLLTFVSKVLLEHTDDPLVYELHILMEELGSWDRDYKALKDHNIFCLASHR